MIVDEDESQRSGGSRATAEAAPGDREGYGQGRPYTIWRCQIAIQR
jgi:hypothetical protein